MIETMAVHDKLQRPFSASPNDMNAQRGAVLILEINASDHALSSSGAGAATLDENQRRRELLKSLTSVSNAVERIRSKEKLTDKDVRDLEDFALDLRLKEQAPSMGLTAVKVHARPVVDGQELAGYQIWWAFYGDADDPKAYTKMPADSLRAFESLTPGLYSMYTKKGPRVGEKTKVMVEATNGLLDIDLPVGR